MSDVASHPHMIAFDVDPDRALPRQRRAAASMRRWLHGRHPAARSLRHDRSAASARPAPAAAPLRPRRGDAAALGGRVRLRLLSAAERLAHTDLPIKGIQDSPMMDIQGLLASRPRRCRDYAAEIGAHLDLTKELA